MSETILSDLVEDPATRGHGKYLWLRLSKALNTRHHHGQEWVRMGGEMGQRAGIDTVVAELHCAVVKSLLLYAQLQELRKEIAAKLVVLGEMYRPHPYHSGEGSW